MGGNLVVFSSVSQNYSTPKAEQVKSLVATNFGLQQGHQ